MSENEASKELDPELPDTANSADSSAARAGHPGVETFDKPRRPTPFVDTFDAPARPRPTAVTDDDAGTTSDAPVPANETETQAGLGSEPAAGADRDSATGADASTDVGPAVDEDATADGHNAEGTERADETNTTDNAANHNAIETESVDETNTDTNATDDADNHNEDVAAVGGSAADTDPANHSDTHATADNHNAQEAEPVGGAQAEAGNDSEPAPTASGFADLGLKPELLSALATLGYEEPTPIQRQTIPQLLDGVDLLGQAATGTGKTAAFALPILNGISKNDAAIPLALIVVPTRELAVQVSEAFFKYGRESRVQVLPVFGGQPISRQLQALRRGVHVVVGTPGRLIDHIKRGSLDLDAVQTVVLDEADEMLDMGFTEDIESILQATPDSRQTVLFSATMPKRIEKLAKKYQHDPVTVKIGKSKGEEANPLIRQTVYMVLRSHKASALGRILDIESPDSAIVFCRTRHEVDELTVTMNGRGYRAEALHGGMDQKQRDRVMARLRDGTAELLVATDVAARGLDVDTLTHVVNYDVPAAPESYVHRIGRVGRAGREGVAITIAEPKQRRLLGNIERLTKQKFHIAKVPSVADLRTKQIEMTVGAVSDALAVQDLEDYAAVLNALTEEHSERDIALAAIKLVHRARGATIDEREIPDASEGNRDRGGKGKSGKYDKGSKFDKGGKGKGKFEKGRKGKSFDGPKGYVHINLGRKVGLRPGDLVGAIANEAGLSGADIGPIKISDHYAVVGVPDSEVENIVRAMKKTTIRGQQAKLRRFTD